MVLMKEDTICQLQYSRDKLVPSIQIVTNVYLSCAVKKPKTFPKPQQNVFTVLLSQQSYKNTAIDMNGRTDAVTIFL